MATPREFNQYLKGLENRASELQQTIDRLSGPIHPNAWPTYLKQFSVVAKQLQTLFEQLYDTGTNDLSTERSVASHQVVQPIIPGYDLNTLRIKPLAEVEDEEKASSQKWLDQSNEETAEELVQRIDAYNQSCLNLWDHCDSKANEQLADTDAEIRGVTVGSTVDAIPPQLKDLLNIENTGHKLRPFVVASK